ncbi:hypothetical protein [Pedobacter paludis]|uniref:Uncharacterized protein n=1 Tax=Pedobacter paludis TaxID=2203212 RepID=A0A317EUE2_9SPHI|nr:hypothetical protein [Pedobacter paludis]PWS30324.1 hypothetical protein DF947_18005 [Pedobacter paludis]
MQQTIPKRFRERLDEIEVGSCIDILDDAEYKNFNAEMGRSFHSNPESSKEFSIRTDKVSKQKKLWRLK